MLKEQLWATRDADTFEVAANTGSLALVSQIRAYRSDHCCIATAQPIIAAFDATCAAMGSDSLFVRYISKA